MEKKIFNGDNGLTSREFNGFKKEETYNNCFNYLNLILHEYDEQISQLALYKEEKGIGVYVNDVLYLITSEGLVHMDFSEIGTDFLCKTDCKILTEIAMNAKSLYLQSIE